MGLLIKGLKRFKLILIFQPLVPLLLFLVGCATIDEKVPNKNNDEVSHSSKPSAQAQWDQHPFAATSEYHFALAQAYSTEGQVEKAIEEYQAALAYDSHSAIILSRLGAEYLKKGSMSLAIEYCKKALEIDSKMIEVRLILGGIYSMNNESDSALEQYSLVLKADPTSDEAAIFKAQILIEKDQSREALKFLRGFLAKVKDSAAAWYYAGKLEQAENHVAGAITDFRKALEVRPGFSQATLALGMIFETHGESKKALDLYQEQLDQKQDLQVAGRLAILYLKSNELELAQKTFEIMTAIDPEDLNTQLKLGLVLMQKQDWSKAKEVLEGILKKVPDSDKVNYYLAAVYEESHEWLKSIVYLLKVSPDSKLFEDATIHAAGLYRKLLQKEQAYQVLNDAIKKAPENPGFYLAAASLHETDHEWKSAAIDLSNGLKFFPDNEKLRYYYGAILDKLGQADEAIVEMEKILIQNPNHADALNFVAYTWTSQGVRLKDAEELLKRALKIEPRSPFILDSMGWNQFMLGHSKEAMVYLEKAASLKSDEQAILEHLVEVYIRNQMPERAQAVQSQIAQLLNKTAVETSLRGENVRAPASVEEK